MSRRLVITCCLVAFPMLAHAQDRQTLFLHGFGAEARDWAAAAERLRTTVAITPNIPSLPWRQSFDAQVHTLNHDPGASSLPANTVVVGHSNGGIVARAWSRTRPVGGLVTIGTPHQGAPILPHFYAYADFHASTPGLLNWVLGAFTMPSSWTSIIYYVSNTLSWMSDFSLWSVANLAATLGIDAAMPVAFDMVPGSLYLTSLNSGQNLAREARDVPGRVGIVSVAHNFYFAGPARAFAPDQADLIAAGLYSSAYGLLFWSSYITSQADPSDMTAFHQASTLSALAGHMLEVDPYYCRLISSWNVSECLPNDGIVPFTSQEFPNAPNIYIGFDNDGPAHTQEKDRSDATFYNALVWYIGLQARPVPLPPAAPPPPGPTYPEPAYPGHPDPSGPNPEPASDPSGGGAASDPGLLGSGAGLSPGQSRTSANGQFHLVYQGDGNLVLYDENWNALWASNTPGTAAGSVEMQGDGNLVVYGAGGEALWASGDSAGHPGAFLLVQNDGNVVIYDPNGTPLWATNTAR